MSLGDSAGLGVLTCNDSTQEFAIYVSGFEVIGCSIVTQSIERKVGGSWVGLGAASGSFIKTESTEYLRRVVTLECGYTLTVEYTLTGTCPGYTLTETKRTNSEGVNSYWLLTGTNTNDKVNILYQNGYTQEFWFKPTQAPIIVNREEEEAILLDGSVKVNSARTGQGIVLVAPDIPDYALYPLFRFRDLDELKLTGIVTDYELTLHNFSFDAEPQLTCLNVGFFNFEDNYATFAGCDENLRVVSCS